MNRSIVANRSVDSPTRVPTPARSRSTIGASGGRNGLSISAGFAVGRTAPQSRKARIARRAAAGRRISGRSSSAPAVSAARNSPGVRRAPAYTHSSFESADARRWTNTRDVFPLTSNAKSARGEGEGGGEGGGGGDDDGGGGDDDGGEGDDDGEGRLADALGGRVSHISHASAREGLRNVHAPHAQRAPSSFSSAVRSTTPCTFSFSFSSSSSSPSARILFRRVAPAPKKARMSRE